MSHSKPTYMALPHGINLQRISAISLPMHLPTSLGNWIHISVVETADAPDPRNISTFMNSVKEHSLLIYNSKGLDAALLDKPLHEMISAPPGEPVLMRIHSLCRFGDSLHGRNCDCGEQLFAAMKAIDAHGSGLIAYVDQEGRGAGLTVKTAANRLEQTESISTADTFQTLGLQSNDLRDYTIVAECLSLLGVSSIRLLSNNPTKINALEDAGITVIPDNIHIMPNEHSTRYLDQKRDQMAHDLPRDRFSVQEARGAVQVSHLLKDILRDLEPRHLERLKNIIDSERPSIGITGISNKQEAEMVARLFLSYGISRSGPVQGMIGYCIKASKPNNRSNRYITIDQLPDVVLGNQNFGLNVIHFAPEPEDPQSFTTNLENIWG